MNEIVTFNDVEISDFFLVAGVSRPLTGRRNVTQEVSGMRGVKVTGSNLSENTVSVFLVIKDKEGSEKREAIRDLVCAIQVDEPSRLYISSDDGLYYMAIPDGEVPFTEHFRSGLVEVKFLVSDPVMYGATHTATIPSGGSVGIYVDGTYPTKPRIESQAALGMQDTTLWGLRFDEADYIRAITGSSSVAKTVEIDSEARVCRVAGAISLPSIDSDWPELGAGMHVVRNDVGTGESTITWTDRWVS